MVPHPENRELIVFRQRFEANDTRSLRARRVFASIVDKIEKDLLNCGYIDVNIRLCCVGIQVRFQQHGCLAAALG